MTVSADTSYICRCCDSAGLTTICRGSRVITEVFRNWSYRLQTSGCPTSASPTGQRQRCCPNAVVCYAVYTVGLWIRISSFANNDSTTYNTTALHIQEPYKDTNHCTAKNRNQHRVAYIPTIASVVKRSAADIALDSCCRCRATRRVNFGPTVKRSNMLVSRRKRCRRDVCLLCCVNISVCEDKKLSYRRETARCVVSVEILPNATR